MSDIPNPATPPQVPPAPPVPVWPDWLSNQSPPPTAPLISSSTWPHRLLHVKSMTSYVRQGIDVYNVVKAPKYNVLSYTWGYYEDKTRQTPALKVHGVDWPIPSIKESHFTVAVFNDAIQRAARGTKQSCEWIWVDVACIPQQHDTETKEAAYLRGQEIGRQVEIFQRAHEAFAWFSSLTLPKYVDTFFIAEDLNNAEGEAVNGSAPVGLLNQMNTRLQSYEKFVELLIGHPWFLSLWTLQEMALRSDLQVLLDDRHLGRLKALRDDIYVLKSLLTREKTWKSLKDSLLRPDTSIGSQSNKPYTLDPVHDLMARMDGLGSLMESKGLDISEISFPHTVYSHARNRRATRMVDRIYGIAQTYGIRCDPFPPGDDETSKLHALEDEFGTKLVAKSPLLSQLYIHGSVDKCPRHSWLITQECVVDDEFWAAFFRQSQSVETLFESLKVSKVGAELEFRGKAWHIHAFLEALSLSSTLTVSEKDGLFNYPKAIGLDNPSYRGLMLDHHISDSCWSCCPIFRQSRQYVAGCAKTIPPL
ncbi:hypothetical protein EDB80DRAFT_731164 [Ilyonectria destructans]|nr:hypothetical protein EDB80DRAFT_731164 [Ilyonectria destructans]